MRLLIRRVWVCFMIATFSIPLSESCVELPRSSRIPSVITWWTSYKKDLKQCALPSTLPHSSHSYFWLTHPPAIDQNHHLCVSTCLWCLLASFPSNQILSISLNMPDSVFCGGNFACDFNSLINPIKVFHFASCLIFGISFHGCVTQALYISSAYNFLIE